MAKAKDLVIVESPAKAKTIEKYLGGDYKVKASMGHLRDLPKSKMGVDLEHDFTPQYQPVRGKEELIRELNALGEAVIFLGDGVTVYQEMLKENMQVPYSFAPAHLNKQRAGAVGALAEKYYREGKTVTAAEHQPEYLRMSQAERERAEQEKKAAGEPK